MKQILAEKALPTATASEGHPNARPATAWQPGLVPSGNLSSCAVGKKGNDPKAFSGCESVPGLDFDMRT